MHPIQQKRRRALERLIARLTVRLEGLNRHSQRLSSLRLTTFFFSLVLIWVMEFTRLKVFQIGVPGIGFLMFGLLVILHCRVQAKIRIYEAWLRIKRAQLAQMRLDWENLLHTASNYSADSDPVDVDLALSGPRSLHHLMDIAVSSEGSYLLKKWLLEPKPDLAQVTARQKVVCELLGDQRFRERFLLAFFKSKHARLDAAKLMGWLDKGILSKSLVRYLVGSVVLCLCGWMLFYFSFSAGLPSYWMVCLLIYFTLYLMKTPQIQQAVEDVQRLDDELDKLKPVLHFLESASYKRLPLTKDLCRAFFSGPKHPSDQLKIVKFYTTAIGLRMNPVMAILLNCAMPWDLLFTYLIQHQKESLKVKMPGWMNAFYRLEAVISLANYAYVNPHYAFPELLSAKTAPDIFNAVNLGHPLIPSEKKVRNDFSFKTMGQVVLITGSNMTGKSTFLKTLGINLKLAFSGGPVDAVAMTTELFQVMTSIRIADSLAEEVSYFYAEVKRLKQILATLEASRQLPVFFLVDEIFKGTNNRERYLGSKPYIKAVSGKNGVGLITTHDVTLCELGQLESLIENRHFGDDIREGKFAFDYKLLPGPSTSTNALRILASEGLPVENV